MLETQRSSSSFLCLQCTAVYGRLRRISFLKSKLWLWSGLFYWFFPSSPENLQRSLSLLGKLSNPHSLHAAMLTAVCVMASHSSWHALCSLVIGNALNTVFFDFYFALSLGSKCIWLFFHPTFFMSTAPLLSFENLKFSLKTNGTQNIRRCVMLDFSPLRF